MVCQTSPHPENLTVLTITHGAYVARNTMPATICSGLIRSFQNRGQVALQCVDIHPGTPSDVAEDTMNALTTLGGATREGCIRKPAMKIPKIVHVPIKPNRKETPCWKTEVNNKGFSLNVTYQAVQASEVGPKEIRVRTKAIASGEVTDSSCVAYAGIVEAVGEALDESLVGSAVVGLGKKKFGSHIIANQNEVIRKPTRVDWATAADSPLQLLLHVQRHL